MKDSVVAKIKKYILMPTFTPEAVTKVSKAAGALCVWVHAIYIYAGVAKEVAPKRARLKAAMSSLATKQAGLKAAQEQLAEVMAKVQDLNDRYTASVNEKNALRAEANELQDKLDRADALVSGLSGEYTRWQAAIGGFEKSIGDLVGDVLVATAFLSYAGPFDTVYRERLVEDWLTQVSNKQAMALVLACKVHN